MEKPIENPQDIAIVEDPQSPDYKRAIAHARDGDNYNPDFGRYGAEEFKKNQEAKVDGTQTGCAACIRATSVQGGVRTTYISLGVIHDHVYKPEEFSIREEPDGS